MFSFSSSSSGTVTREIHERKKGDIVAVHCRVPISMGSKPFCEQTEYRVAGSAGVKDSTPQTRPGRSQVRCPRRSGSGVVETAGPAAIPQVTDVTRGGGRLGRYSQLDR